MFLGFKILLLLTLSFSLNFVSAATLNCSNIFSDVSNTRLNIDDETFRFQQFKTSTDFSEYLKVAVKNGNTSAEENPHQNGRLSQANYKVKLIMSENPAKELITADIDEQSGHLVIKIQVSQDEIRNPALVALILAKLTIIGIRVNSFSRSSLDLNFISPVKSFFDLPWSWAQIYFDAQRGGEYAKIILQVTDLYAKKIILRYFEQPLIIQKYLSSDKFKLGANELLDKFTDKEKMRALHQSFEAAINERSRQLAQKMNVYDERRQNASKEFAARLKKDHVMQELKSLVKNNDRQKVVDLLLNYFPWNDFDPTEKALWSNWLSSMVYPSGKKVLLFRGMSAGDNPVGNGGSHFILSPLFFSHETGAFKRSMAVENEDQLASALFLKRTYRIPDNYLLATLGLQQGIFGQGGHGFNVVPEFQGYPQSVAEDLGQHSEGASGAGDKYISWTDSYEIANQFARGGPNLKFNSKHEVAAIYIDENRVIPNVFAKKVKEYEWLTLLFTFPDETVSYLSVSQENYYNVPGAARMAEDNFFSEISEKLGRSQKEMSFSDADYILRAGRQFRKIFEINLEQ